jgi:penicillin-binding protein 1A
MAEQKKKGEKLLKVIFTALVTMIILLLLTIGVVMAIVAKFSKDLPDVRKLNHFEPSESSQIFSSEGSLIGILYKENRTWVPIKDIPQKMQEALIATEDSRFYHHGGIDPKGILRAMYANFRGGDIAQGASTITQQLARNVFLGPERSMKRKIQEILISLQIEKSFSKKDILEFYLNQIYFGAGAYGIESAAQIYFGKHAKALTLPECAMIAGLPAAPSVYSPLVNEKKALERQKVVLSRMAVCGFITPDEEQSARDTQLVFAPKKSEFQMIKQPYFTTYALHELSTRYDADLLYRGGLKIYTTLDLARQKAASQAIAEGMEEARQQNMNASNAAMVAVDPRNGFIVAMVGGREFTQKNQFNRAWQAKRLPGSSFKVFVYGMALEQGYTPETLVDDVPVTYAIPGSYSWSPKNSDGRYSGTLNFRDSLKWSRNVCAVKVLNSVGVDKVIDCAKKMGISDILQPNLSLALGSSEVTVLEMASAYGVIATGGKRCKPTTIKFIKDSHGKIIEDNRTPRKEEAMSQATAFTLTEMLQEVVKSGTGTAAQIGRPAAGKTGTTDEHRDAWFVGFVPQLSCAVWTGNDDNSKMNHVYGGTFAAKIWARFMKKALMKEKILNFSTNEEGKVGVMICNGTGLRATGKCPDTKKVFYAPGSVPERFCAVHGLQRLQIAVRTVPKPSPTARPSSTGIDKSPPVDEKTPVTGTMTPGNGTRSPVTRKSGTPGKILPQDPEVPSGTAPTLNPGKDSFDHLPEESPDSTIESPIDIEENPSQDETNDTTITIPTPGATEKKVKTPGREEM